MSDEAEQRKAADLRYERASDADAAADMTPRRIKLPPGAAERLAREGTVEGPRMLPGMAMISIFLLVYALLNAFQAMKGVFGFGMGRYAALAICTLLVVGVFGLLRLRRWGWALVLGGTLFVALFFVVQFIRAHVGVARGLGFLVWAMFFTLFFLYLVRDEVRRRLH